MKIGRTSKESLLFRKINQAQSPATEYVNKQNIIVQIVVKYQTSILFYFFFLEKINEF